MENCEYQIVGQNGEELSILHATKEIISNTADVFGFHQNPHHPENRFFGAFIS